MDSWLTVISAASGLLGAVIGITSTLFTERWRARTTQQQEQRLAASRLRDERKDALLQFFALIRDVERLAEKRHEGQRIDPDEASDLTSQLWLRQLEVRLVCSDPAGVAIHEFTDLITNAVWDPPPVRIHVHLGKTRLAALKAARDELGIDAAHVGQLHR